jgi:hypothetical protein
MKILKADNIAILSLSFFHSSYIIAQKDSIIRPTTHFYSTGPVSIADSVFNSIPNVIDISFMEGFNDSVFLFKNGKAFDSLFLNTNQSLGFAGNTAIHFNKGKIVELIVRFRSSSYVIREKLNLNYKHLQIRNLDGLELYYSNHFPVLE